MIFQETRLPGAFFIDVERKEDERGFFARTWCENEFAEHQLEGKIVQCNISFNKKRGTLRGMHYQSHPHAEGKVIRCTRGSIFDVIVDLRPESPQYKQYLSVILSSETRRMLYIPKGFAHGFQTLEDETEVFYHMTEHCAPHAAKGFRWNDPAFKISWPDAIRIISEKDRSYPDFFAE